MTLNSGETMFKENPFETGRTIPRLTASEADAVLDIVLDPLNEYLGLLFREFLHQVLTGDEAPKFTGSEFQKLAEAALETIQERQAHANEDERRMGGSESA